MEYTVNGLARLAGVSVRTLHWYDEIGLLRPARVTEAGYRMYGPDEVDALQSILFYRALGVPLKQIGALMADASAGRLAALQSHRAALLCRRAQLDALLATLDKMCIRDSAGGGLHGPQQRAQQHHAGQQRQQPRIFFAHDKAPSPVILL